MVLNEEAKIDPTVIDPIWIVTQREAMLIKGITVPIELENQFKALENPPAVDTEEISEDRD